MEGRDQIFQSSVPDVPRVPNYTRTRPTGRVRPRTGVFKTLLDQTDQTEVHGGGILEDEIGLRKYAGLDSTVTHLHRQRSI